MASWIISHRIPDLYKSLSRFTTLQWNATINYTRKSAEEKLGIEKPKRPMTPYLKFASQIRPSLTAKHPGLNQMEIAKLTSQHWQHISNDLKEKITKEYEREKEEYAKVKAAYDASLSDEQKVEIKKLQQEMNEAREKRKMKAECKELGRPKKPMSSYFLFCQSEKNNHKNLDIIAFQLKMKEKWYALGEHEKNKWNEKASKLKEEYRKKLTEWEEKMVSMGNIDLVRNKRVTDKKSKSA